MTTESPLEANNLEGVWTESGRTRQLHGPEFNPKMQIFVTDAELRGTVTALGQGTVGEGTQDNIASEPKDESGTQPKTPLHLCSFLYSRLEVGEWFGLPSFPI